jgi:hypothetical protein
LIQRKTASKLDEKIRISKAFLIWEISTSFRNKIAIIFNGPSITHTDDQLGKNCIQIG